MTESFRQFKRKIKKRHQADKMRPAVVEARNVHYGSVCARCERRMPNVELAWNSIQHHNAKQLVCKDSKSCNRIARKLKRRAATKPSRERAPSVPSRARPSLRGRSLRAAPSR